MAVINTLVLGFLVPVTLGFTYVQTVFIVSYVSVELCMEGKDKSYDVWSWAANLPIVVVGWLEAVACDWFLIEYGGHLYYDTVIIIVIIGCGTWEMTC